MMVEYYNLEKTAEMLKMTPAEIHRLREQGKLRGLRDGHDWKFVKDQVDQYLLEVIKGSQSVGSSPFEIQEDLLTSDDENLDPILADSAAFDALVDKSLVSDGLVPNGAAPTGFSPDDEMTMVANDNFNIEGLILDDGTQEIFAVQEPKTESKSVEEPLNVADDLQLSDGSIEIFGIQQNGSDINLTGDSGISLIKKGSSGTIDLSQDDDLVLGGSSGIGGSDINLAGDSGISLIDAAAESDFAISEALDGSDAILELTPDDDILALMDDDVDADTATVLGTENDFQLTINLEKDVDDDSESSSQVIAIEDDLLFSDMETEDVSVSESIEIDDAFADLDSNESQDSAALGLGDFGSGFDASEFSPIDDSAVASPFGSASGIEDSTIPTQSATSTPLSVGSTEPFFTGASVSGLAAVFFLLFFAGTLIFDLIRNMWSWQEPFVINSAIMNALKGILG